MAFAGILLGFFISLIVSAIVIYLATKLFGEKEGFITAILAALIGSVIFSFTSYFIGMSWIASLIGGVAWLISLGILYKIGWIKSFAIALVIWIFSIIANILIPTITGPL